MTAFVIHRARGEIFDYDFDKQHRDHKLERDRFSYGGFSDGASRTEHHGKSSARKCLRYAPLMPFIGRRTLLY
jgi:hypothetical protein